MVVLKGDLEILAAEVGLRVNIAAGRHEGQAIGLGVKMNLTVASKRVNPYLRVESEADDRCVRYVGRAVWIARQQFSTPGTGAMQRLRFGLICDCLSCT